MLPSSRTPEGHDNHCPICGQECRIDPTVPPGDAPCPHCGCLLWFEKDRRKQSDPTYVIHSMFERLRDIAAAGVSWDGLVRDALWAAQQCLVAKGAAYWRLEPHDARIEMELQFASDPALLAYRKGTITALRRAPISMILPPLSCSEAGFVGNPTRYCLMYVPVLVASEAVGFLELALRPASPPEAQLGMRQWIERIAEILATHREAATPPTAVGSPGYEAMSALEESLEAMEFRAEGVCSLAIRVACSTSAELEAKLRQVRAALDEWSFRRGRHCGTLSLTVALPPELHEEFRERWDELLSHEQEDEPFWAWLSLVSARISLADENGAILKDMPLESRLVLVPIKPWWQFW